MRVSQAGLSPVLNEKRARKPREVVEHLLSKSKVVAHIPGLSRSSGPRRRGGKGGITNRKKTSSPACSRDAPASREVPGRDQPSKQVAAEPFMVFPRSDSRLASVCYRRRVYYAKRATACHAADSGDTNKISWIIDSGANVVVVPTSSCNILRWCKGEKDIPVQTAGGRVLGRRVVVHTPIGHQNALALPDAPHLLPMYLISKDGSGSFTWSRRKPVMKYRGRRLPVWLSGGNPMVSSRRVGGCVKSKGLLDDDQQSCPETSVAPASPINSRVAPDEPNQSDGGDDLLEQGALFMSTAENTSPCLQDKTDEVAHLLKPNALVATASAACQTSLINSCYVAVEDHMPKGFREDMTSLHITDGQSVGLTDAPLDPFDQLWVTSPGKALWNFAQNIKGLFSPAKKTLMKQGEFIAYVAQETKVNFLGELSEDQHNFLEEPIEQCLLISAYNEKVRQWYVEEASKPRTAGAGLRLFLPQDIQLAPGETRRICLQVWARGESRGRPCVWSLSPRSPARGSSDSLVCSVETFAGHQLTPVHCELHNNSLHHLSLQEGDCVARIVGALNSDMNYVTLEVGGFPEAEEDESREDSEPGAFVAVAFPAVEGAAAAGAPAVPKGCKPRQPGEVVASEKVGPNRQMKQPKVLPLRKDQIAIDPTAPPPPEHYFTHSPAHPNCPACARGKLTNARRHRSDPQLKEEEKAKVPGERLMADLCGPWPTAVHNQNYLMCVLEESTGLIFLFALKGKTPGQVKFHITEVRKQLNELRVFCKLKDPPIWHLKTDLGGEFDQNIFKEYLADSHGTLETIAKGRHIAVVERCLRECTEGIRTLLTAAGLPARFWPFAASTWAHNHNMGCDVWRQCQEHHRRTCNRQVFGLLCFAKLPSDGKNTSQLPKGCEVGSPCCYIGPMPHSRKCSHIIYVDQVNGGYHTTSIDNTGLRFIDGVYAFKRVYLDLNTISAPGTEMSKNNTCGDLESTPGEVVGTGIMRMADPVDDIKKKKRWTLSDSDCQCCRTASKHAHTFKGRGPTKCRFSQLDKEKVNMLMNLGLQGQEMYSLLDQVVSRILDGETWDASSKIMEREVNEILLARAQRALDTSKDVGEPDLPAVRTHFVNHGCFGEDAEDSGATAYYTQLGEEKNNTSSWKDTMLELDKQMLNEQDRSHYVKDLFVCTAWDTLDEYTRTASAFVTRNMNRVERQSEKAKEALSAEMSKVEEKGTFGAPMLFYDARRHFPEGTVSGLCMLGSVKHAEKQASEQKFKGRLVVLGNAITRLRDLVMVFPKGSDFGMQGQVASLSAFRAVAWHSTSPGYVLEAADVSNAYLNATWPEDHQPHFLRIDKTVYEALCPETRKKIDQLGGWQQIVLPMDRCLYGHPISGFMWIEMMRAWLMSPAQGFVEVDGAPSLFKRGETLICVYVDDVAAAGPKGEVRGLWEDMKKEWALRESEECTEFLGIQVSRQPAENPLHGYEVHLTMSDYVNGIVKTLKEEFPDITLLPRYTPMTDAQHDALAEQHQKTAVPPQHRCMKIVGQLIWLSRCMRPDISFSVSKLASGISRWGEEHNDVLGQLVGYLVRTHDYPLRFKARDPDRELIIQLCPDASWAAPRSQSGSCLVIGHYERGREVDGVWTSFTEAEITDGQQGLEVLGMFEGCSVRQGLTGDSSACTELISAHTCLRTMLPLALGLRETWNIQRKVELREDNKALCAIAQSGNTKGLAYLATKPMNIRANCLFDLVELGAITVSYVRTHKQLGDCFTKALDRVKLEISRYMLGLGPIPSTSPLAKKAKAAK